jgi:hypothetical protein
MTDAQIERLIAALEKLADKPVVLPTPMGPRVWDDELKDFTMPDVYAERRAS